MTPDDVTRWRIERGLTQGEAAELAGVGKSTWKSWEYGTRRINPMLGSRLSEIDLSSQPLSGECK